MPRNIIRTVLSLFILAAPVLGGACSVDAGDPGDVELRQLVLPDPSTPVCPPLQQASLQTNLNLLEQAWPAGTIPQNAPQGISPAQLMQLRLSIEAALIAGHDQAMLEVAGGSCTDPVGPFNFLAEAIFDPNVDVGDVAQANRFLCHYLKLELEVLQAMWNSLRDVIMDCMTGDLTCSQSTVDTLINAQSQLSRLIDQRTANYQALCL